MIEFIEDASAITLKPKQEFFEWLESEKINNNLSEEVREELKKYELNAFRMNGMVIAIPLITTTNVFEEVYAFIDINSDKILSAELFRWGLDMSNIPPKKTIDLLKEWFDITCHRDLYSIKE